MNRAAKSAPYIPVANGFWVAFPCKRGIAGILQGVGFDTDEAPQTFIHSALEPIAALYGKTAVLSPVVMSTRKRNTYLDAVNELGQGNVRFVTEDV